MSDEHFAKELYKEYGRQLEIEKELYKKWDRIVEELGKIANEEIVNEEIVEELEKKVDEAFNVWREKKKEVDRLARHVVNYIAKSGWFES